MEQNIIYTSDGYIFSEFQINNDPTNLTPFQTFLFPYVGFFEILLWILWVGVLLYTLRLMVSISTNKNSLEDSQ